MPDDITVVEGIGKAVSEPGGGDIYGNYYEASQLPKLELVDYRKRPNYHFVGRKSELDQIDALLDSHNHIFLEGMGGIGKTELVKKYVEVFGCKFHKIQFLRYLDKGLFSTIVKSLKIDNFDADCYEKKYGKKGAMKHIFDAKMSHLKKLDKDTLIIIDNYDVLDDDYFVELTSGKYKVIFTSRVKHNADSHVFEVTNMKSEKDLLDLFRTYYKPAKLADEDLSKVKDIINEVNGHTMTIMLIATAMYVDEISPEEMLEQLKKGLDAVNVEMDKSITISKEDINPKDSKQEMYTHVKTLFKMLKIFKNENRSYHMSNMAIIPYAGIKEKLFLDWTKPRDLYINNNNSRKKFADDLEWLIERRWIQREIDADNKHSISLHPVISDVVNNNEKLKPDSKKCLVLIQNMIKDAKENAGKTYTEWLVYVNDLELACRRIRDKTEVTANLHSSIAEVYRIQNRHEDALKWHQSALEIRKEVLGKEHKDIATSYHDFAAAYRNRGDFNDFETSLELHLKALDIRKNVLGQEDPYTADSYNNIAYVLDRISVYTYNEQKDKQKKSIVDSFALEMYEKAIDIRKKIKHPDIATSYNNIARIYRRKGDFEAAINYHNLSLEIREKKYKCHHYTARTYNSLAGTLCAKGDFESALELYKYTLLIRKRDLGEGHSYTASTNHDMALLYNAWGKFDKALDYYFDAFVVREKIFGDNHQKTVRVKKNMERAYESAKKADPFEDWLQNKRLKLQ